MRTLVATPSPEPWAHIAAMLHRHRVAQAASTAAALRAPVHRLAATVGAARP